MSISVGSMKLNFSYRLLGVLIALLATVVTGGVAITANSHDSNQIHACANRWAVRIVDDADKCKRRETHVSWNIRGALSRLFRSQRSFRNSIAKTQCASK